MLDQLCLLMLKRLEACYNLLHIMNTTDITGMMYDWEDIDLDTSVCSVCKKPQEYETKYCPECGAKMENNGDDDDE